MSGDRRVTIPFYKRQLLVDAKTQAVILAYTFFVAVVMVVLTTTCALLARWSPGVDFSETRAHVLWLLVGGGSFVILSLVLGALYVSNKIAGPIFRMRAHLREIADGKPVTTLEFRHGDCFVELANDYNRALAALQDRKNNRAQ